MIIIGCDYHPAFQQIALVDIETGDWVERRLEHREAAEKFYRDLAAQGKKVRVGMEASGHARWFERLLSELQFELWVGDAAEINSRRVRKQKTDRQDAQLILRLMLKDDFPQIWVPSWENRDLRQLLWHRHRMVQARTRIMNQLQAVALNEGLRCKKKLWREAGREQLEAFKLAPWASQRRGDLLELLDRLNPTITQLTQAIDREVEKCPAGRRLQTHPGVGPLTALAFVLIIGKADRFQCGKQTTRPEVPTSRAAPSVRDPKCAPTSYTTSPGRTIAVMALCTPGSCSPRQKPASSGMRRCIQSPRAKPDCTCTHAIRLCRARRLMNPLVSLNLTCACDQRRNTGMVTHLLTAK
jgi:transposase